MSGSRRALVFRRLAALLLQLLALSVVSGRASGQASGNSSTSLGLVTTGVGTASTTTTTGSSPPPSSPTTGGSSPSTSSSSSSSSSTSSSGQPPPANACPPPSWQSSFQLYSSYCPPNGLPSGPPSGWQQAVLDPARTFYQETWSFRDSASSPPRIRVVAPGRDIGGTSDSAVFLYKAASSTSNFQATVRLTGHDLRNVSAYAKISLVYRESLAANARSFGLFHQHTPTSSRHNYVAVREETGESMRSFKLEDGSTAIRYNSLPFYYKLAKVGRTIISYTSTDGATFVEFGSWTFNSIPDTYYWGIAMSSAGLSTNTSGKPAAFLFEEPQVEYSAVVDQSSSSSSEAEDTGAVIAGAVGGTIAGLLLVAGLGAAAFVFYKKRKSGTFSSDKTDAVVVDGGKDYDAVDMGSYSRATLTVASDYDEMPATHASQSVEDVEYGEMPSPIPAVMSPGEHNEMPAPVAPADGGHAEYGEMPAPVAQSEYGEMPPPQLRG